MTFARRFLLFFGLADHPPVIRRLVLVLAGIHVVALGLAIAGVLEPYVWGSLLSQKVMDGQVWRLVTYGLLHDLGNRPVVDHLVCAMLVAGVVLAWRSPMGRREPALVLVAAIVLQALVSALGHAGPLHLVLNLLAFAWFGPELARRWGARRFLGFVVACVAGGALVYTVSIGRVDGWITGIPVVGISAAASGLLVALAVYDPHRVVMASMLVPLKFVYLVVAIAAFNVIDLIPSGSPGIAPMASRALCHLGGMLTTWLLTSNI